MTGAFTCMASFLDNLAKVQPVFRTGSGVAWGDQATCLFCAVAQFFRPGYLNNIVGNWLPALDGVVAKLERGAKIADVGCGHGVSTVIMAKAFPNSQFIGYDFHPSSIEHARAHAKEHDVTSNARFEVGTAKDYPEKHLDLVTFFDCLHDMGDPAGAAAHVDDRRADGRRPARGQSEPGRADLLRGVDDGLRAHLAVAGSGGRSRRAGWRGQTARGHHCGRVPQRPARCRDAVQHAPTGMKRR